MIERNTSPRGFELQTGVPLAPRTTIGLGGRARYFAACRTVGQVRAALRYARERGWPLQILGGGSNIVFADAGYAGLVLKVDIAGITFEEQGPKAHQPSPGDSDRRPGQVDVTAGAGEAWDALVRWSIERDLAGLECLSGIPGSVGATPVQNVGAYGQEVSDTLVSLRAVDQASLEVVSFSGEECRFAYRRSRFKREDRGRYVITEVTLRLERFGRPTLRYPELARYVEAQVGLDSLEAGRPALEAVRAAVLALRRSKSMLADPDDPDARSVGSFFLNPVLSPAGFRELEARWREAGGQGEVPTFPAAGGIKVPAAWLVERAGFPKGYRRGGVGVSDKHALALVNRGGTTGELLALAGEIQERVYERFGARLEVEPVVVPYEPVA